jgi:hypothetical protein
MARQIRAIHFPWSRSTKYAPLKPTEDSMKDISFRLNCTSIRQSERSLKQILDGFQKPLATIGMDAALEAEFATVIANMKAAFAELTPGAQSEQSQIHFWELWHEFDAILHKIAERPALAYCRDRIEGITGGGAEVIARVAALAPAAPALGGNHRELCQQLLNAFAAVHDRLAEAFDSARDEAHAIAQLEAARGAVRKVKADLAGRYSACFAIPSVPRARQEALKATISAALADLAATLAAVRRQAALIRTVDGRIARALRIVAMMVQGKALAQPRPPPKCESADWNGRDTVKAEAGNGSFDLEEHLEDLDGSEEEADDGDETQEMAESANGQSLVALAGEIAHSTAKPLGFERLQEHVKQMMETTAGGPAISESESDELNELITRFTTVLSGICPGNGGPK